KDGGNGADHERRALERYGLVQTTARGNQMHEFIRLSVAAELRDTKHSKWEDLNSRAAQSFFRSLDQEETEYKYTAGGYGRWYKYERPEWQYLKREWLYHSGQLPGRRELVRARFTLVFLEAFWWWGCYHPFPFNHKLLEDWERTVAAWGSSRR